MNIAPPVPRRRTAEPERVLPRTRKLVLWSLLGGFLIGYVFIWLVFFPGLGRATIVTVPDLRGTTLSEAKGSAEDGGMAVVVGSTIPSPYVAAGHVLAQEPMPGQEVTRGAVVHLIMSSGPSRRHVPDLAKLDLDEAKALLARFGFTVIVTTVLDPSYEGKILAVQPASGTDVPLPATVRLTVSAGPPKVTAPDVVGLSLGDAEAKLDSAGLRLGRVNYDSASVTDLGAIEGQRPAAGDSVRQGGSVSVVVSGRAPYVAPVDSLAPADGTVPVPPAGEPQGEPPPAAAASPSLSQTPPPPAPKPAAPARAEPPAAARPPARTGTPAAPAKPPVRPPAARPPAPAPRPAAPSNDGND